MLQFFGGLMKFILINFIVLKEAIFVLPSCRNVGGIIRLHMDLSR